MSPSSKMNAFGPMELVIGIHNFGNCLVFGASWTLSSLWGIYLKKSSVQINLIILKTQVMCSFFSEFSRNRHIYLKYKRHISHRLVCNGRTDTSKEFGKLFPKQKSQLFFQKSFFTSEYHNRKQVQECSWKLPEVELFDFFPHFRTAFLDEVISVLCVRTKMKGALAVIFSS